MSYSRVFFWERSSFIFRLRVRLYFREKETWSYPIIQERSNFRAIFFGKTIFSGRLEKENMVFRAVCDKRDSFPFSIIKMPYLCSNVLWKIFYASIGAEILKIVRTKMEKLKSWYAKIISRMIKQEGVITRIKQCLCKIRGCNFETFRYCLLHVIFF